MVTLAELLPLFLVASLVLLSLVIVLRRSSNGASDARNGHTAATIDRLSIAWQQMLRDAIEDRDAWRELALRRGEQLGRMGVTPASRTEVEVLTELAKDIERRFSAEELDTLAFDVGIRPDSLPGETLPERARQLVMALDRRNRLSTLVAEVKRQRPD